jgi:hypothetical protein
LKAAPPLRVSLVVDELMKRIALFLDANAEGRCAPESPTQAGAHKH